MLLRECIAICSAQVVTVAIDREGFPPIRDDLIPRLAALNSMCLSSLHVRCLIARSGHLPVRHFAVPLMGGDCKPGSTICTFAVRWQHEMPTHPASAKPLNYGFRQSVSGRKFAWRDRGIRSEAIGRLFLCATPGPGTLGSLRQGHRAGRRGKNNRNLQMTKTFGDAHDVACETADLPIHLKRSPLWACNAC